MIFARTAICMDVSWDIGRIECALMIARDELLKQKPDLRKVRPWLNTAADMARGAAKAYYKQDFPELAKHARKVEREAENLYKALQGNKLPKKDLSFVARIETIKRPLLEFYNEASRICRGT